LSGVWIQTQLESMKELKSCLQASMISLSLVCIHNLVSTGTPRNIILVVVLLSLVNLARNFWKAYRLGIFSLLLLSLITPELQAQKTTYQQTEPFTVSVSMPNGPQENPICVLVIGAVGVWVGIKIISACLNVWEHHETNANNNPLPEKLPFYATSESSPIDTGPEVVPTAQTNSPPSCGCDTPKPLPILIQHSFDLKNWETVSSNPKVGSELLIPANGFIRAVPFAIQLEDNIMHVPPGVLEWSDDLSTWFSVATNNISTFVQPREGFYRVKQF
jgi:hypothetical protein